MIVSLALCATLQLGAGTEGSSTEVPFVQPMEVQFDKSNAVIGEPVTFDFSLSVADAEEWMLAPAGSLFAPEQGWLELSREESGQEIRLTLAALEAKNQENAVPPLPLTARDGSESVALLLPSASADGVAPFIAVSSALGEGEDSLRPELGLREVEFGPGGQRFVDLALLLVAALLVGLAALVFFLVRRRRRGMPAATRKASGLERLAEIEASADVAIARAQAFETTRLLREVIDRRAGESRAGATDAEWLRDLDEAIAISEQRRDLSALFAEVEAVKYGGATQTTFAQDELLVRARRLAREISTRPETVSTPVEAA